MLHTVNKSPFEKNSLESCLRLSQSGASVLMIEDGVYGALQGTTIAADVTAAITDKNIYVLGPDLKARGIEEDRLIEGVKIVDYAGFVDLAASHPKVQSWM